MEHTHTNERKFLVDIVNDRAYDGDVMICFMMFGWLMFACLVSWSLKVLIVCLFRFSPQAGFEQVRMHSPIIKSLRMRS